VFFDGGKERLLSSGAAGVRTGWFAALADPRLREAVAAIHRDPARRWTLADLAKTAAMSRSSFAEAFRNRTGETPMSYLARWRMMLAADRLAAGEPASVIAPTLGYESDSAFSVAFKRMMGRPPRAFAGSRSAAAP